jgi:hypothetical protein
MAMSSAGHLLAGLVRRGFVASERQVMAGDRAIEVVRVRLRRREGVRSKRSDVTCSACTHAGSGSLSSVTPKGSGLSAGLNVPTSSRRLEG